MVKAQSARASALEPVNASNETSPVAAATKRDSIKNRFSLIMGSFKQQENALGKKLEKQDNNSAKKQKESIGSCSSDSESNKQMV